MKIYLLSLLLLYTIPSKSGTYTKDSTKIKPTKYYLIGAGIYGASLIGLNELWYKNHPRTKFHFFNDNDEWNQMDKLGHFYSSFQLGLLSYHALQKLNVNEQESRLWGSLIGFMLLTPIELLDGYSEAYGASLGDIGANALGSAFLFGQLSLWKEIRIHPKFSFYPTEFSALRPHVLGQGLHEELLKDYNGQRYWLSFDLSAFLPRRNFPKWLNIAIGYGADNMIYAKETENNQMGYRSVRRYFLSLDIDLSHIPSKHKWVRGLLHLINMIHLPAPAIEINADQNVYFHPIFF